MTSERQPGRIWVALGAMLLGSAGCGPEQTFRVSNVDRAAIDAGEHEVTVAEVRDQRGLYRIDVALGNEGDPCRVLSLWLCKDNVGSPLTVATSSGVFTCFGDDGVTPAIFADFTDTCSSYETWRAVRGEATVEMDGEDAHLRFTGTMDGFDTTAGAFDVEVDVVAEPASEPAPAPDPG